MRKTPRRPRGAQTAPRRRERKSSHGAASRVRAGGAATAVPRIRPVWDELTGELWFRGALLRERGRKLAPLEERVLGAFQRARWRRAVSDPLNHDDPASPELQLREAVRRLNRSLKLDWLRFHSAGLVAWWEDGILKAKAAPRQSPSRFDSPAPLRQRARKARINHQ